MKKMPWVKLSAGFLRDEKIHFIIKKYGHDTMVVWTGLLTECKRGMLEMDEEIFTEICIMDVQRFDEIKKILIKFGLVTQCNGEKLKVTNWEKYQFSESYERVKSHRQKAETECNADETDEKQIVTVEGEEEGDKEEEKKKHTSASPPPCPYESIISLYHDILPTCPRVSVISDKRKRYLQTRWRERPSRQKLAWWQRFFEHVEKSAFLTGKAPPSAGRRVAFVADLEWLTTEGNFIHVIEGKYHDEVTA